MFHDLFGCQPVRSRFLGLIVDGVVDGMAMEVDVMSFLHSTFGQCPMVRVLLCSFVNDEAEAVVIGNADYVEKLSDRGFWGDGDVLKLVAISMADLQCYLGHNSKLF